MNLHEFVSVHFPKISVMLGIASTDMTDKVTYYLCRSLSSSVQSTLILQKIKIFFLLTLNDFSIISYFYGSLQSSITGNSDQVTCIDKHQYFTNVTPLRTPSSLHSEALSHLSAGGNPWRLEIVGQLDMQEPGDGDYWGRLLTGC